MTVIDVNPDLVFTHADSLIILKDYVCAVCYSELKVQPITGDYHIFIVCPDHGNVCLCGRVMRSSVSIRMEYSHREYYPVLAALPDLFGNIWTQGIPSDIATRMSRDHVCALCGDMPLPVAVFDENRRIVPDIVTLTCRGGHGNVGLNGIGIVPKDQYTFIPPVEYRRVQKIRAGFPSSQKSYISAPATNSLNKLGVVTLGTRKAEESTPLDHLNIIMVDRTSKLGELFKSVYGSTPQSINIRFLSDSLGSSFYQGLECYRKGALTARAKLVDGDWTWDYYRDPETHDIEIRGGTARTLEGIKMGRTGVDPSQPIFTDSKGTPHFLERTGHLRFLIPELVDLDGTPVVGYFEMTFRDAACDRVFENIQEVKRTGFQSGRMLPELQLTLSIDTTDGGQVINIGDKNAS